MTIKTKLISIPILLALVACQSPIVPVRSYTFNATFAADGRQYALSLAYQCHYEDIGWISARGPAWHVRKGTAAVRIIGRLNDGTAFEVLPSPEMANDFCPEHGGEITSRLFISTTEGNVRGLTAENDKDTPHQARLLQSTLKLVDTGYALFSERMQWPQQTTPAQHFYTIQATYYDSASWKQNPDIAALVHDKTVPWFDDATVWPFMQWTDNDVIVARARQHIKQLSGDNDAGKRFAVAPFGKDWRFAGPNDDVTTWRPARRQPESRDWIEYAGRRIELPLHRYDRLFYEEKSERLIEFRAVYIDLW